MGLEQEHSLYHVS